MSPSVAAEPVFVVDDLTVSYRQAGREVRVVEAFSLDLLPGEILGLAGESGCGKSTAVLASTGFGIPNMASRSGKALLGGTDLLGIRQKELRRAWGKRIAYLPQDASTSLTPTARIERLFAETLTRHLNLDRSAVRERTNELLRSVGLPHDANTLRRYPFEFSGGQQQRIALAMALACQPDVLILDEPTTGLDVTTQAMVSALVRELVEQTGTATIYVSHDLRLLHHLCDRIAVMYAGQVVEVATAATIWDSPRHPYTGALLDAVPDVTGARYVVPIPGSPPSAVVPHRCSFLERCSRASESCGASAIPLGLVGESTVRCIHPLSSGGQVVSLETRRATHVSSMSDPVLALTDVRCVYRGGGAERVAADSVTLSVGNGDILGIVGESGSGKSTLLRCVIGLHAGATGEMRYCGDRLPFGLGGRSAMSLRGIQMVFQNPASSLNPRQTVRSILRRPLDLFRRQELEGRYDTELASLMESVRLSERFLQRYPSELSGGQQQRVALARALAASPNLVLCDEIVSSLDVSVQASILDLVQALRAERGVSFIFVTHDLGVVRSVADHIIVMQSGRVVEAEETEQLFLHPKSTYTTALLRSALLDVDAGVAEASQ